MTNEMTTDDRNREPHLVSLFFLEDVWRNKSTLHRLTHPTTHLSVIYKTQSDFLYGSFPCFPSSFPFLYSSTCNSFPFLQSNHLYITTPQRILAGMKRDGCYVIYPASNLDNEDHERLY